MENTLHIIDIRESRASLSDSVYPWDIGPREQWMRCAVQIEGQRYDLHVVELPDGGAAWNVRRDGRDVAASFADDLGTAIARAEHAAEAWAALDARRGTAS